MSGKIAREHRSRVGVARAAIGVAVVLASGPLLAVAPGVRAATAQMTAVPSEWSGARMFPLLVVEGGGSVSDIGPGWDIPLRVGTDPSDVAVTPDGQDAYVTNQDGTVSVIRGVQTLHPTVLAAPVRVGNDPTAVAVSPNSRYAYVVNRVDGTVSVIGDANTANPTVIKTLQLGDGVVASAQIAITPDGKYAYVSTGGALAVIDDAESGEPVVASKAVPVTTDGGIVDIAMTPNGQYAYIAEDSASGGVLDIIGGVQTADPKLVRRWKIGTGLVDQVAVTPDGKYAYVADSTDKVLVITGPETTHPVISESPVPVGGLLSYQVAVQPDGDYASVMTCNSDFCDGLTEIAGASTPHPKAGASWSPGTGLQAMAYVNLGMAALGDSYSSGNGTTGATGDCVRSFQAWPELLPRIVSSNAISRVTMLACSGADSNGTNMSPKQDLPAQIAELRNLKPAPGIVTLTIGGDDGKSEHVGFFNVLVGCVLSESACAAAIASELKWIAKSEPTLLHQDYSAIRDADKSATILVVGYPQIFPDAKCGAFTKLEAQSLDNLTLLMDMTIAKAAAEVPGAEYVVKSATAFDGHQLCASEPWIVAPLHSTSTTDWMHPNNAGQQALAEVVADFMATRR